MKTKTHPTAPAARARSPRREAWDHPNWPPPEATPNIPKPGEPMKQPPGLRSTCDDLGSCIYSLMTMQLADPTTLEWFRDVLYRRYEKVFADCQMPRLGIWTPTEGAQP